jgi:outer membrane lipoprotein SlyB
MDRAKTHPILIAAGGAVLVFSLLGAAALTGLLPAAITKPGEPAVATPKSAVPQHSGTAAPARPAPQRGLFAAPCPSCGVIAAIQQVEVKGKTSGLGAVAGAVAGGALGHQIGRGDTRTVMALGGATGGAFAGDAIESNMKKRNAWRVTVHLEDGSVRTLSQNVPPPFAVGDRVRIVSGSTLERA